MSAYEAFQTHAAELANRMDRPKRGRTIFLLATPFLVITLFLAATADDDANLDAQVEVIAAAETWAANGPSSYSIAYTVVVGDDTVGSARVDIANGAIAAFETADPVLEDSRVYTVDATFLALEAVARGSEGVLVAVDYHPDLGYVTAMTFDPEIGRSGMSRPSR